MDKITRKTDQERIDHCLKNRIVPEEHCCLDMAWFISEPVEWASQGPNPVIMWIKNWNEYRIHVTLKGKSSTIITYCPWCSTKLPESKKELWHKELLKLGYGDPREEDIPKEYTTDEWWKQNQKLD